MIRFRTQFGGIRQFMHADPNSAYMPSMTIYLSPDPPSSQDPNHEEKLRDLQILDPVIVRLTAYNTPTTKAVVIQEFKQPELTRYHCTYTRNVSLNMEALGNLHANLWSCIQHVGQLEESCKVLGEKTYDIIGESLSTSLLSKLDIGFDVEGNPLQFQNKFNEAYCEMRVFGYATSIVRELCKFIFDKKVKGGWIDNYSFVYALMDQVNQVFDITRSKFLAKNVVDPTLPLTDSAPASPLETENGYSSDC
jgi:hypothetical protein